MSVYRGICPHGAYEEVLDINDALCVGQMLISGQVGRNRNGSGNRAHWEWERQENKTSKIKKYSVKSTDSGCSDHFSLLVFTSVRCTSNSYLVTSYTIFLTVPPFDNSLSLQVDLQSEAAQDSPRTSTVEP